MEDGLVLMNAKGMVGSFFADDRGPAPCEARLRDYLDLSSPPDLFLSERAAGGIFARAARRGVALPDTVAAALLNCPSSSCLRPVDACAPVRHSFKGGDCRIPYFSLCSGIEAASVAWARHGFHPSGFSEVDGFASAVLAARFASVPKFGDKTSIDGHDIRGRASVIVAGTPCQAFSLAGLRKGACDPRGALAMHMVRICNAAAPDVLVWENVAGVLRDPKNAFGVLLSALAGLGEAVCVRPWPDAGLLDGPLRRVAWRVLDAAWFGLPQRRRRVFLVAAPCGGIDVAKVLFDDARLEPAPFVRRGDVIGFYHTNRQPEFGNFPDLSPTLKIGSSGSSGIPPSVAMIVGDAAIARRFSPGECEALMGLPEGWTDIGSPGRPCAKGPRYRAVANSIAAPCIDFIGERLGMQLG